MATPDSHKASATEIAANENAKTESRRKIPDKCLRCALLSINEVRVRHGDSGDRCYNPQVCRSRRSYARHQMRRNEERRIDRHYAKQSHQKTLDLRSEYLAILQVYRAGYYQSPIDGIGVEVRQGKKKVAAIAPIYCGGMTAKSIYACLRLILVTLKQNYGIEKFSSYIHLPPRDWQSTQQQVSKSIQSIQIEQEGLTDLRSAILIIYRDSAHQSVCGIAAEIWRGSQVEMIVPPISAVQFLPTQIHAYITKILQVLEAQYGIRKFSAQYQFSAEAYPQLLNLDLVNAEGSATESESSIPRLELDQLWAKLEPLLTPDSTPALEKIAMEISDIVEEFVRYAELTFDDLQTSVMAKGSTIPEAAFMPYVRQSMLIDIQPFMAPPVELPRKESASRRGDLPSSAIAVVEKEQLFETLGDVVLSDAIAYEQAISVAHSENIEGWMRIIAQYLLETTAPISLRQLVQSIDLTEADPHEPQNSTNALIKTWLALLLGGYVLENRGDFYSGDLWISQARSPLKPM
jgi:hypothetical protein